MPLRNALLLLLHVNVRKTFWTTKKVKKRKSSNLDCVQFTFFLKSQKELTSKIRTFLTGPIVSHSSLMSSLMSVISVASS